jgi:serpin B
MGMPLAFSRGADFSGMTSGERLMISEVVHQAYVNVNEQGTEAAAATGVTMMPTAAMPVMRPKAVFKADHPFLFMIRDGTNGSVLFMGRVSEPGDRK